MSNIGNKPPPITSRNLPVFNTKVSGNTSKGQISSFVPSEDVSEIEAKYTTYAENVEKLHALLNVEKLNDASKMLTEAKDQNDKQEPTFKNGSASEPIANSSSELLDKKIMNEILPEDAGK